MSLPFGYLLRHPFFASLIGKSRTLNKHPWFGSIHGGENWFLPAVDGSDMVNILLVTEF